MSNNTHTPQRQARFRQGMLCMYRERLQVCQEEFMAASAMCNIEHMRDEQGNEILTEGITRAHYRRGRFTSPSSFDTCSSSISFLSAL